MTNPSRKLRDDTRVEHRRIGGSPIMRRLFQADYSRDEYRDLLTRFYGVVKPLEQRVSRHASAEMKALVSPRFKTEALEADLKALGMDEAQIAAIPLAPVPNKPISDEAVLGLFYVTEGQTQGGKIISRGLRKKFGASIENALNFYDPYGADVDAKWDAFKAELDNRLQSRGQVNKAIAHANDSFRLITGWLTANNPMMGKTNEAPNTPPKADRRRVFVPVMV